MTEPQLFLLGDSIIDNRPYIASGEPDVTAQVAALLPAWRVRKLAVDGYTTQALLGAPGATAIARGAHVVLSIGGNDALQNLGLMSDPARRTFLEAMLAYGHLVETFRANYVRVLDRLVALTPKLMVLTIYRPRFGMASDRLSMPQGLGGPQLQRGAEAALTGFNDVIAEEAMERRLRILDIRQLFLVDKDYANPIEPSAAGGAKLARAIAAWVR